MKKLKVTLALLGLMLCIPGLTSRCGFGRPYTKVNAALVTGVSYKDSAVVGGTTYFYTSTAVDASVAGSDKHLSVTATVDLAS